MTTPGLDRVDSTPSTTEWPRPGRNGARAESGDVLRAFPWSGGGAGVGCRGRRAVMGSRKKKDKRKQKKRRARQARPALPSQLGGVPVVVTPGGAEKMSEVLMRFVEPYSQYWQTEDQLRRVLSVALVAWNAAVASGSDRDALIQSSLEAVPADVREDMRAIIAEMMQRKEAQFASNKRLIVDYQLTMTPTGPHVSVISTFAPT